MIDERIAWILNWYKTKNWSAWPFQLEAWREYYEGNSGLISVPTGAGKTYAAFLAPLADLIFNPRPGLQILYITPLRALARDLKMALELPINDFQLPFRVEMRTGDTSQSHRQKQNLNPPEILLTTPESLALLLSDSQAKKRLGSLQAVIADEWHELLGTKRGVLLELCLSRLKQWNPRLRIWGMSATVGNLEEAAKVCVGCNRNPKVVHYEMEREIILETVLPETLDLLPWTGLLGLRMLPYVLQSLSIERSTLIFTNTRSQAERWHQAIIEKRPEWREFIALHHSSVDRAEREQIESGIKIGLLKIVVCTSSLDLGIDFAPVERVIQIGSPKSVARLIQRAGRSSHRPLSPCHIALVPTHALEIAEIKGFRMALSNHIVENRSPLKKSFDVLIQHLTTCSIGGGFKADEMFEEIKTTYSFAETSREEFEDCIHFLVAGGRALNAYPEYQKLVKEEGIYLVRDRKIALRHKMNIGTITSDPHVPIILSRGKRLGTIEEKFIGSLRNGDYFLFGGKILQLIQYKDLTAYVKIGKGKNHTAAVWQGSRLPYSAPLGELLRQAFTEAHQDFPERSFLQKISTLQSHLSSLPKENEILFEVVKSREGWHLFIYPFEGKNIHEGLVALVAHRLSRQQKATFTLSTNDYGFEILSNEPFDEKKLTNDLFHQENLIGEINEIINVNELAKGFFRDIARIAGLVFQGYPGSQKSNRQIQMSSSLLFSVFNQFDPDNLLLLQAKREVIEKQFEWERLKNVLTRLSNSKIILTHGIKLSPFALPLFVERVSSRVSTETLVERIEKIKAGWND